ncbi:MAG: hypothetical protein JNK87_27540 [Bryobacterales bacterium]|nr:hypothetical protein [Bryobacterales bacterium]
MSTTRRTLLAAGAGLTLAAAGPGQAANAAVDAAHAEIWRRFIDPTHGTFYDYAPPDGAVHLPTPEECAAGKPNALGWSSPIENGAFFGGLYLDALCNRWRRTRDARIAAKAKRIAQGLVKLATIGKTPGFVARGISTDGVSHHAASSSDQTFPWFYGLWRYTRSGLPDPGERTRVEQLLVRVITAIEANQWCMPCDRDGFGYFGRWSGGFAGSQGILNGAEPDFDAAARLLLVHRAMYAVTGEKRWLVAYKKRLTERASDSARSRLEVLAAGVPYVPPGTPARFPASPAIWTSASSQAGLRALHELEDDTILRAAFRQGLQANARRVMPYIDLAVRYDNGAPPHYTADWRPINRIWTPQQAIGDAVTLGNKQKPLWLELAPRRAAESEHMRDPLFAAWIVALSADKQLIEAARPAITRALGHFEWKRLFTSLFFMAECVQGELETS